MPITTADLEFRLTVAGAAGGDQLGQDDPAASLGGNASATAWAGGVLHDLFGPVTGDANAAEASQYRCVFVVNRHPTLTWTAPKAWLSAEAAGGAEVSIGVDPTAATALAAEMPQARATGDGASPPSGVAFSRPLSKGAGVALGDLPPGYGRGLWVRLRAVNSAGLAGDYADLSVEGDTL